MKILVHWLITAAALVAAAWAVPGITVGDSGVLAVGVTAVVLGLVNVFVRPVLRLLGCAFIVLTLGLFLLVINAFTLWLAGWVSSRVFHLSFVVDGFWPAFWGGIIVSVVSWALSFVLKDERRAR